MAVKEKDPTNEKDAPVLGPTNWFDRLDEFGQKHARVILTVAAGLIILTVLIVANQLYKSSEDDRVARDLAKATSVQALKELKDRYAGKPQNALVIAKLGNVLYAEGRLEEAKKEFDEFTEKYREHPLSLAVSKVLPDLEENLRFESEQKEALLALSKLDSHPVKTAKLRHEIPQLREELEKLKKNPERAAEAKEKEDEIERRLSSPLGIGPIKLPHPVLVFKIKDKEGKEKGVFRVELFEDEAPNTVAALVELAEKKHFDGQKFTLVGVDDATKKAERVQMPPKALDYVVPFEPTVREGLSGSLIMVRQGANNLPGEFQILCKSVDAPGDVTVCGVVAGKDETEAEGHRNIVRGIVAEDIIDSVTVERKRSHEYKPKTVKP